MSEEERLGELRNRIDAVDDQLLELLNRRARIAQEVAEIKRASGGEVLYYRAEREAQVQRRLMAASNGPLPAEEVARLFREIMSACRSLEHTTRIAFLGPAGTFTQTAAFKHFGHSVETLPQATVEEVFREVESGGADYGVVPVENSTEGVITHTLDRLIGSPLTIVGEVQLRIHQNLLGKGESLEEIRRIYSHRQSLAQCRHWLDAHLPHAERIDVGSNAEGARRAAQESGAAAVGPEAAAEIYGLRVVEANIEDQPDNTTRFLVLGNRAVPTSGADKSSLLVAARNVPGALFQLLEPLARNGISMNRIESRPSRQGVWEYLFFIDVEGHASEPKVAAALRELEERASFFRVLGAYPKAIP